MCLGVPGQIVEIPTDPGSDIAVARVQNSLQRVNVGMLTTPVMPGTWVVVHMGFAMETLSAEEAQEIIEQMSMDL